MFAPSSRPVRRVHPAARSGARLQRSRPGALATLGLALLGGLLVVGCEEQADLPAVAPLESTAGAASTAKDGLAGAGSPGGGAVSEPGAAGPSGEGAGTGAGAADPTPSGYRFAKLGPLTVPVPGAWQVKETSQAPQHSLHVTPGPGLTCDVGLIQQHGSPDKAEGYLNSAAGAYRGEVTRNSDLELGGEVFQGIHIAKPQAFAQMPHAVVDVYVAIKGTNLIGLGFTDLDPGDATRALRKDCEQEFAKIVELVP